MPPITILLKPASGNCNMRCEYCFYYDTMTKREQFSYGFMSMETLEAVIVKALAYAEETCFFVYQGGEPTLCGLEFFQKSMELQNLHNINNIRIENALQTNGYHLDREWADFFVKNNYLVGVSLDGRPKQHDSYRKNIQGNGTFVQVMKNIEMLQKAGVDFNILSVVNNRTAPDIKKAYKFFRKNHLDYLQFIACLDPLGEVPGQRTYSLTPEVYGQFLMDLFHLWYEDLKNSRQPYIRQFENYIAILTGQMPESCDMVGICGMQYVVEADGSTYPCDFYVTEKYLLGNLNVNTIEEIDREREAIAFIKNSIQRNEACEECRYVQICRGGCRRTRIIEAGHRQYFCKSYQMFFDACLPDMIEIAQRLNHGAYSAHT